MEVSTIEHKSKFAILGAVPLFVADRYMALNMVVCDLVTCIRLGWELC